MADKTNLLGKQKRDHLAYECETKWALKKHKERSKEKETNSEANLIPVKERGVEGLDETPQFVEGVAERKKTLIIHNIPPLTTIPDLVNFFKDDGKVVCVRRFINPRGRNIFFGSVEFSSANEAKTAQEKKNGEYFRGVKITLGLAKTTPYPQRPPRLCREHKVWYPHFFEGIAAIEETIFVANLSPQTKMLHILKFFGDVGEVLSVRLIVNHEGRHVGYGFVEYTNAYDANKAVEKKNGKYLDDHKIFLDGAKSAPCPPRPKYSIAEKLWYEDYLLRESFPLEEDEQEILATEADESLEGHDETPKSFEIQEDSIRQKTLIIDNMSCQTKISDIIDLFKDVGQVVHVRLIVNEMGELKDCGFVEFASADEAKRAQEKKKGEYLCGNQVTLCVAEIAPYLPPPKYCIDHKVWYEDYLRGEGLMIEEEEDEATEGLDDIYEEVSLRKKTLFISKLPVHCKVQNIINFFYDVGEVSVRIVVDDMDKLVGCAFVTFASAIDARKALTLRKKIRGIAGHLIDLDRVEIAPYPLRPKYNLAEKRWYEDYLPRERLWMEETIRKRQFCGKKITFPDNDD